VTRPIRDLDVPLPTLRERIADLVARQRAEQPTDTQPETTPEETP
jgi:hypothetical protein